MSKLILHNTNLIMCLKLQYLKHIVGIGLTNQNQYTTVVQQYDLPVQLTPSSLSGYVSMLHLPSVTAVLVILLYKFSGKSFSSQTKLKFQSIYGQNLSVWMNAPQLCAICSLDFYILFVHFVPFPLGRTHWKQVYYSTACVTVSAVILIPILV